MANTIPDSIVNEIRDKVDIAEVISGYIPLKRAGRNFKANCPFHHEKTPSFMVNPDKQIYHCFGCGEGGNVFTFIMKQERMEFPEVVRMLAEKTGVVIPESTKESREKAGIAEQIYKVNSDALLFFHGNLLKNPEALGYLRKRGISDKSISEFKIGLSLNSWDALLNFLRTKGYDESIISQAGLILSKEGSRSYYDRFRQRIMFPVFDIRNNVIGFGGRVLDNTQEPKYLNTPETPVYLKGKNLYGLNFSKGFIRDMDSAILVEGYLDFITPFQFGIKNIIASCGTALTSDHVRLVRRFSENIIVVYDPDKAGELATLRSLDILVSEGVNVKVVRLPEGFDPDTFVKENGPDVFNDLTKNAKGLFDYKLGVLYTKFDKSKPEDKIKIINEMLPTITKITNEILKSEYLKRLAQSLNIEESMLVKEMKKTKRDYEFIPEKKNIEKKVFVINPVEKHLLSLMFEDSKFIERAKSELSLDDFDDLEVKKIISFMFNYKFEYSNLKADNLINHFKDEDAANIIAEIASSEIPHSDKEKCFNNYIQRIKEKSLNRISDKIRLELKEAEDRGDQDTVNKLYAEVCAIQRKLKAI